MYVGSISNVELTRVSGFLEKLEGKHGILVMANQIVCVCANFHPVLLPPPVANSERDVEDYFQSLASDSGTDTDIGDPDIEL